MRFELDVREKEFIESRKNDPEIHNHLPVKDAGEEMSLGIKITDPVKASYILTNLLNNRDEDLNAGRDLGFEITRICLTPATDYTKIEPFKEELLALVDKHFYGEEN